MLERSSMVYARTAKVLLPWSCWAEITVVTQPSFRTGGGGS